MEKKYIELEEAIAVAMDYDGDGNAQDASQDIASALSALPAVKIVRCKDCIHGKCKHQDMYLCYKDGKDVPPDFHEPDWFCADGQRLE